MQLPDIQVAYQVVCWPADPLVFLPVSSLAVVVVVVQVVSLALKGPGVVLVSSLLVLLFAVVLVASGALEA